METFRCPICESPHTFTAPGATLNCFLYTFKFRSCSSDGLLIPGRTINIASKIVCLVCFPHHYWHLKLIVFLSTVQTSAKKDALRRIKTLQSERTFWSDRSVFFLYKTTVATLSQCLGTIVWCGMCVCVCVCLPMLGRWKVVVAVVILNQSCKCVCAKTVRRFWCGVYRASKGVGLSRRMKKEERKS